MFFQKSIRIVPIASLEDFRVLNPSNLEPIRLLKSSNLEPFRLLNSSNLEDFRVVSMLITTVQEQLFLAMELKLSEISYLFLQKINFFDKNLFL